MLKSGECGRRKKKQDRRYAVIRKMEQLSATLRIAEKMITNDPASEDEKNSRGEKNNNQQFLRDGEWNIRTRKHRPLVFRRRDEPLLNDAPVEIFKKCFDIVFALARKIIEEVGMLPDIHRKEYRGARKRPDLVVGDP